MKLKVMIRDGIVESVLCDDEAMKQNPDVTIVDYNRNDDSYENYE